MAKVLDMPKASVRLVAGTTSACKVIEIEGLDEQELRRRLAANAR